MVRFNPFDKPIDKIEKDDLNKLIDNKISEGWYVEYKEDFISPRKLAAAVAAFANSDGGWLIIGVRDDNNNTAREIAGIDLKKHRQPKEQIRDTLSAHLNPIPKFTTQLIHLAPNRGVVVIEIEAGNNAPYMTRDGVIYRRISEGKDPITETDRYVLEKLFERAINLKKEIEEFSKSSFYVAKNQSSTPYLEIFLYPQPINGITFEKFNSKDFFIYLKEHFSKPVIINEQKITPNLKFDNIFSSYNSYIIKSMVKHEELLSLKTTIEIQKNGMAKLIIPIKAMKRNGKKYFPMSFIQNSQNWKIFSSILEQYDTIGLKIIDGFNFFIYLTLIFKLYFSLLKENNFKNEIGIRIKLNNTNGTLIYFNSMAYLNFVEENKLPVGIKKRIEIPRFLNGDMLNYNIDDTSIYKIINTIFSGFGINSFILDEIINDFPPYLSNYLIFKNKR